MDAVLWRAQHETDPKCPLATKNNGHAETPAFERTLFHKFVIELDAEGFFTGQGETAHWSYAATRWLDAAMGRILVCNAVVYTGLAHRQRADARAAPFAMAANVRPVLAHRLPRAAVRHAPSHSLYL